MFHNYTKVDTTLDVGSWNPFDRSSAGGERLRMADTPQLRGSDPEPAADRTISLVR